jgi:hypothetical protein
METGRHISCAPRFKFVATAHRNINNNFLFLRHGSFHEALPRAGVYILLDTGPKRES